MSNYFTPENYQKLESEEAKQAFLLLREQEFLASVEAKVKADEAALTLAEANKVENKTAEKLLEGQNTFLSKYPKGYIYLNDLTEVIKVEKEAMAANIFVRTFVEEVASKGYTKVVFSIPKKKK